MYRIFLPSSQIPSSELQYHSQFGSYGTGPGNFYSPKNIHVDLEGNIYVIDGNLQKFDSNGVSQFQVPNA